MQQANQGIESPRTKLARAMDFKQNRTPLERDYTGVAPKDPYEDPRAPKKDNANYWSTANDDAPIEDGIGQLGIHNEKELFKMPDGPSSPDYQDEYDRQPHQRAPSESVLLPPQDDHEEHPLDNPPPDKACYVCGRAIYASHLIVKNHKVHRTCLVCNHCHISLENRSLLEKDDKFWCSDCFHSNFSKDCSRCGEKVIGATIRALGGTWHPKCFVCQDCSLPFDDGSFQQFEGKPWHPKCWDDKYNTL